MSPRPLFEHEFPTAWLDFTKGVRVLLVPQVNDRPLDQYLEFRDRVVSHVQEGTFVASLNRGWFSLQKHDPAVAGILLAELRAFPRAVEVAQSEGKAVDKSRKWWKRLLGRGSTVTGSVSDILKKDLPFPAQMGLTAFRELLDLFKG